MDKEWMEVLTAQYDSYTFLSRMYRQEVSLATLNELVGRSGAWAQPGSDSGLALIAGFLQHWNGKDLAGAQVDLAADYAGLFLNASQTPVYPYESVYTSEERLLMQKARDQMIEELRSEGLALTANAKEPEDHIAIELEFVAHLCQKTIQSLEQGDLLSARQYLEKQKSFLDKHLLVWAPTFCDDTFRAARTDFYKGVAQLTKDFLASERGTIDVLIGQL